MKETHEHAEEIQTNTAMFAGHKEKEGGTVNSGTPITIRKDLEIFGATHPGKTLLWN